MTITEKRAAFHANREICQNADNLGNGIDESLEDKLFERSLGREGQSIRVEDTKRSHSAKSCAAALRAIEIYREQKQLSADIDFI